MYFKIRAAYQFWFTNWYAARSFWDEPGDAFYFHLPDWQILPYSALFQNCFFFDINLLRTYNHSITTLAKQQDFLLFVVTGT